MKLSVTLSLKKYLVFGVLNNLIQLFLRGQVQRNSRNIQVAAVDRSAFRRLHDAHAHNGTWQPFVVCQSPPLFPAPQSEAREAHPGRSVHPETNLDCRETEEQEVGQSLSVITKCLKEQQNNKGSEPFFPKGVMQHNLKPCDEM